MTIAPLTDEQRMDNAVREGTSALREIAEQYDVSVQDLSARFAGAAPPPVVDAGDDDAAGDPAGDGETPSDGQTPADPGSDIERALQETEAGPAVPELTDDIEEEDPIFPE